MKKTLLLLPLLVAGIMQAQIVNVPDANFKALLLSADPNNYTARDADNSFIKIDVNEDGEIQFSETMNVYHLNVTSDVIASYQGVQSFTNLESFYCGGESLMSLDINGLNNLKKINCSNSPLTSVEIGSLTNLEDLAIYSCNLNALNVAGMSSLKRIFCAENSIEVLEVSNLPNLEQLNCSSNLLTELTLSNLPALRDLNFSNNPLETIDLSQVNNLSSLRANDCPLTSLDVTMLPTFRFLQLRGSNITELDLSQSDQMFLLHLDDNELLESINLKNGNIENSFEIHISESNTALQYICIDEDDQIYADSDVLFSTYCTFTPGGDYNVITGSLLFDNDGNCDTNGTVISNIKLNINDGTESGSTMSSTGLYNFFTQSGTYTVTPDLENDLFTINPPFAEVSFTAVDSLVTTQNFCLTPNGNHPDLDIVIVPFGAQPGFDANYKIVYRNKGNQTLSGSVVFTYGEDVLDFVSANPSEDSSSPGTLTWNYTNLAPFQQREIFVTLNVNGPMEIPPVNIDDQLGFTATVSPVAADETPGDNIFELKQIVVGSFDPNDITCLEGRSVNPDKIGEYLHYNINFENTGTAPANFIVVKDVINTEQFDMATLQMINASHPVQATVTDNKLEFRFDAINLGPQGKGNVVFKIKTLNTLQVNDDVTQQADIFFDYNWPIVTNEATTVFEVLSRGEFEKDNSVKVYPNPSNGLVNISAASEIRSVELYDVQGRLLQAGGNISLDISGRAAGMYFVKVVTEAGMKVEKVIKK